MQYRRISGENAFMRHVAPLHRLARSNNRDLSVFVLSRLGFRWLLVPQRARYAGRFSLILVIIARRKLGAARRRRIYYVPSPPPFVSSSFEPPARRDRSEATSYKWMMHDDVRDTLHIFETSLSTLPLNDGGPSCLRLRADFGSEGGAKGRGG